MAYVLDPFDVAVLNRFLPQRDDEPFRCRVIFDPAESEESRSEPEAFLKGFLRGSGVLPREYSNVTIIKLSAADDPEPIPDTDCYRVTCYDIYCNGDSCYAICFDCIVCDDAASLFAPFRVAAVK